MPRTCFRPTGSRWTSVGDDFFPARPLRWLFLDLNSYFASAEQHFRPALRGRPVIVIPADTETTCAIAASVEAKARGVRTGTSVREARRICPDLTVVVARPDVYVDLHHQIVAEIERHIPVTSVLSVDEVACRLLDNENSREQVVALAGRIKRGIRKRLGECMTASIGVAPNRLVAKLASDLKKPDGLVVIESHDLPEALFGLPLDAIAGIGTRMRRRLSRAGVNDVRRFCELGPRDAGAAWGGTAGDRLWWHLHGVDLPEKPTRASSIGHSYVLPPDERGAESAWLAARRLAIKAASRLRRGGYRARLFMLHARMEDMKGWGAEAPMPATQDSFLIVALVDALLPRLREAAARSGGRVRLIAVTLAGLEETCGDQASLWDAPDGSAPLARGRHGLALSRAMDRIQERWGRDAVALGLRGVGGFGVIGTKIAFGRIPDQEEYGGQAVTGRDAARDHA